MTSEPTTTSPAVPDRDGPPRAATPATRVTFPQGAVTGTAAVLATAAHAGGSAVIVDTTPFHPVDHRWPDQAGDTGAMLVGDRRIAVVDTVLAAQESDGPILLGADIPVRRGAEGWSFLVAHLIEEAEPAVGKAVELLVDLPRRQELSAGHTGCHVAAAALNSALADRWTKETATDGLGHPDFDGAACTSSLIEAHGSVDRYRLGKSLRKKGFDALGLAEQLAAVQQQINATLAAWVASGAQIGWEIDGPLLTDRRTWICHLPQGQLRLLCGGTHLASLGELTAITVELVLDGEELVMTASSR